ncbi:MAG: zinc ribbon domain-containing protein, partial [Actinobacteria bacterium]|nr:zinc ribbon domain-containing protein [Actinomycetota bacterium]
MAFCTACGQPSDAAARFCTTCGAPFPDAPFPDTPRPARQRAGEPAPEEDDAFGNLFAPRRDAPGNRNDTARLPPMTAPGGPAGGGPAGGGAGGGWA